MLMKQYIFLTTKVILLVALCLTGAATAGHAQEPVVEMSALDGVDITPDNIFSFGVQSFAPGAVDVTIRGVLRYRNSDLKIDYEFTTKLQPGMNLFSRDKVHTSLRYSSGGLRELFEQHRMLPFGTYQYCVSVAPATGENNAKDASECVFRQSEDQFMITLVEPENKAKIYEYNPVLSWLATYSFSGALTYRIRVAEIKEGQNTASAIARNNPVYEEKNLTGNSIVYPVYAKPLKAFQSYAWTVDAYYKGILLGGAEPWRFIIIEDSLLKEVPHDPGYIELNVEKGNSVFYAVGELKLKYIEKNRKSQTIHFTLTDQNNKAVKLRENEWKVSIGDNRITIPFHEVINLKHWKYYKITAETETGQVYTIPFRYVNPLYLK